MATYEDIYGKRVKFFDSDPTLNSSYEGQVWYDSATGVLKSVVSSAVAVTSTNMPTAVRQGGSVGATQNAFIFAGGANPSTNYAGGSYEYDGSGWTTIPSITARSEIMNGAMGTTTAGVVTGGAEGLPTGASTGKTELWNGSSWTETGDMSTGRRAGETFGSSTAAVAVAGFTIGNPPYWTEVVEEFNGSSWTSGTAAPRHNSNGCGVGTQTAGMIVSQREDPSDNYLTKTVIAQTREYDGTNWTTGGTVNLASASNSVVGTQSSCRKMGGGGPPTPSSYTNQEEWNDTVWTTDGALASGVMNSSAAGTASAAVVSGGYISTNLTTTQEVTKTISTLTAAAWASGNALNTARAFLFGVGPQTAALGAGGYTHPPYSPTVNSEEYDGTSWTEGNNLNTGRYGISGLGTQTAAVAVGGDARPPGSQYNNNSEHYDGSSWTNATAYPVAIGYVGGAGTQTAGVIFGGGIPGGPRTAQTTEYDGTSWTTSSPQNMNTARSNMGSGGTQTAAIGFGGSEPAASNKTETYNGSTWTAGGTLINSFPGRNTGGGGPEASTTDILAAGGPPHKTDVEGYNGTSWSTRPSLATGRSDLAGGGTSSLAVVFGGDSAPVVYTGLTEEFTGETETVTAKTLTTS